MLRVFCTWGWAAVVSDDQKQRGKVTVPKVIAAKGSGRRLAMVTAYDYAFATIINGAPIDIILVGDSGGMTTLGYSSTLPVTMDEMIMMAKAVARGAQLPLLVGDLPFMSYETSPVKAAENAGRMLKEAGMDAVKLEGGVAMVPAVEAIVRANIPVMGHIGLTPQSLARLGGFRVQGRDADAAESLVRDARALEAAGAFAIVIEAVPAEVGAMITDAVAVPTIGIGAGPRCDGQVLVLHDLLGLFDRFRPKFVKQYADLGGQARAALASFADEVRAGLFPAAQHCYSLPPGIAEQLEQRQDAADRRK